MENTFKGKVVFQSNINWKTQRIEKDFNSQDEFDTFVNKNPHLVPFRDFEDFFPSFGNFDKALSNMNRFLSHPFFDKIWNVISPQSDSSSIKLSNDQTIDLNSYKNEISKIENEKKEKDKKKESLDDAKKELENYIQTFENEWKHDLAKKANEDLLKINQELKNL